MLERTHRVDPAVRRRSGTARTQARYARIAPFYDRLGDDGAAQVPRDPHDPAAELGTFTKLSYPLETRDQRILCDVFGVVHVAQDAQADEKDVVVMPADQIGVRRAVPPARGHHQVFVATFVQTELHGAVPL